MIMHYISPPPQSHGYIGDPFLNCRTCIKTFENRSDLMSHIKMRGHKLEISGTLVPKSVYSY